MSDSLSINQLPELSSNQVTSGDIIPIINDADNTTYGISLQTLDDFVKISSNSSKYFSGSMSNAISASSSLTTNYLNYPNTSTASYSIKNLSSSYSNFSNITTTSSYTLIANSARSVNPASINTCNVSYTSSYLNYNKSGIIPNGTASYTINTPTASLSNSSSYALNYINYNKAIYASFANTSISASLSNNALSSSYASSSITYTSSLTTISNVVSSSYSEIASYASSIISNFTGVGYPETYGAVGDGVTDDWIAIKNCVLSHSIVQFDAKTYAVRGHIPVPSNTIFQGKGIGITTLKIMDNSPYGYSTGLSMFNSNLLTDTIIWLTGSGGMSSDGILTGKGTVALTISPNSPQNIGQPGRWCIGYYRDWEELCTDRAEYYNARRNVIIKDLTIDGNFNNQAKHSSLNWAGNTELVSYGGPIYYMPQYKYKVRATQNIIILGGENLIIDHVEVKGFGAGIRGTTSSTIGLNPKPDVGLTIGNIWYDENFPVALWRPGYLFYSLSGSVDGGIGDNNLVTSFRNSKSFPYPVTAQTKFRPNHIFNCIITTPGLSDLQNPGSNQSLISAGGGTSVIDVNDPTRAGFAAETTYDLLSSVENCTVIYPYPRCPSIASTWSGSATIITASVIHNNIASVTCSFFHNLSVGNVVAISGFPSSYNCFNNSNATILSVSNYTSFTYYTGSISTNPGFSFVYGSSITTASVINNNTASVTSSVSHGLLNGDIISMSGFSALNDCFNNSNATVLSTPSLVSFTYVTGSSPTYAGHQISGSNIGKEYVLLGNTVNSASLGTASNNGVSLSYTVNPNCIYENFTGSYDGEINGNGYLIGNIGDWAFVWLTSDFVQGNLPGSRIYKMRKMNDGSSYGRWEITSVNGLFEYNTQVVNAPITRNNYIRGMSGAPVYQDTNSEGWIVEGNTFADVGAAVVLSLGESATLDKTVIRDNYIQLLDTNLSDCFYGDQFGLGAIVFGVGDTSNNNNLYKHSLGQIVIQNNTIRIPNASTKYTQYYIPNINRTVGDNAPWELQNFSGSITGDIIGHNIANISIISASLSTTINGYVTASITSSTAHGLSNTTNVDVTGFATAYSYLNTLPLVAGITGSKVLSIPSTTTLKITFAVPYGFVITGSVTNVTASVTTSNSHGFVVGNVVSMSGFGASNNCFNNSSAVVISVPSTTTFTYITGSIPTYSGPISGSLGYANVSNKTLTGSDVSNVYVYNAYYSGSYNQSFSKFSGQVYSGATAIGSAFYDRVYNRFQLAFTTIGWEYYKNSNDTQRDVGISIPAISTYTAPLHLTITGNTFVNFNSIKNRGYIFKYNPTDFAKSGLRWFNSWPIIIGTDTNAYSTSLLHQCDLNKTLDIISSYNIENNYDGQGNLIPLNIIVPNTLFGYDQSYIIPYYNKNNLTLERNSVVTQNIDITKNIISDPTFGSSNPWINVIDSVNNNYFYVTNVGFVEIDIVTSASLTQLSSSFTNQFQPNKTYILNYKFQEDGNRSTVYNNSLFGTAGSNGVPNDVKFKIGNTSLFTWNNSIHNTAGDHRIFFTTTGSLINPTGSFSMEVSASLVTGYSHAIISKIAVFEYYPTASINFNIKNTIINLDDNLNILEFTNTGSYITQSNVDLNNIIANNIIPRNEEINIRIVQPTSSFYNVTWPSYVKWLKNPNAVISSSIINYKIRYDKGQIYGTYDGEQWLSSGSNLCYNSGSSVGIGVNNPSQTLQILGSITSSGFILPYSSSIISRITGSMFYSSSKLWIFTGTANNYGAGTGWSTISLSV